MKYRRNPVIFGAIVSLIGALVFTMLFSPGSITAPKWFFVATLKNFATYFVLWIGNRAIYKQVDRRVSWFDNLYKRLSIGMAFMMLFSLAVIFVPNYVLYQMEKDMEYAWEWFYYKSMVDFLAAVIMMVSLHSMSFFYEWKTSLVRNESLQKENLESQFEALKSQISPHFLFNSLNVLSTLIHKNVALADEFINRLSMVYRYLLDSRDKEVVELAIELEFIRAYLFLLKTRFGDNLKVDINLPENRGFIIPPMSLQLLIENAIKHNEISEKRPLKISINTDTKEYLVVTNNLQPRKDNQSSTHIGLGNIRQRYAYLTGKPVVIAKEHNCFVAKIPLLTFEPAS